MSETRIKQILSSEIAFSKGQITVTDALSILPISRLISAFIGPDIVRQEVAFLNSLQASSSPESTEQTHELPAPIQLKISKIISIAVVTIKEMKVFLVLSWASSINRLACSVEYGRPNILLIFPVVT